MLLEYAELENICQHARLVHNFSPGLIGIFGPNGCGKSNFVNMIKASLTGDFRVNPGVKDDNIKWDAGDGAVSYVTTRWNHLGTKFTVRRGLKNIGNSLIIEGDKIESRGAKDIEARIESLLGLSKRVVDFMFVPQWRVFSFISDDATERATTFSHLCGTAQVEKAYRILGDQIKGDQALVADVLDTRVDIRDRVTSRTARIAEMAREVKRFSAKILKKADGERYESIVKNASKHEAMREQLLRLRGNMKKLAEEYNTAKAQRTEISEKIKKQQTLVESLKTAADDAKDKIKQHKAFKARQARAEELEAILEVKPLPRPPQPSYYLQYDTLIAQRALLKQQHASLTRLLNTFDQEGVLECPTCLTPVKDLQSHLDEYRHTLPDIDKELVKLNGYIQSCENHRKAIEVHERENSQIVARRAAAKAELDSIDNEATSFSGEPAQWQASINRWTEEAELLAGMDRRWHGVEAAYNGSKGRLLQAKEECQALEDGLKELNISPADVAMAKKAIEDHRTARSEIKILEARIGDLESANAVDQEEIQRIGLLIDRTKVAREWLTDMDMSREFAHRDNFPRLAAQRWLEDMTELINHTLEQFDSPFYIEVSEDLTFIAIKPNGRRERAERLSGGEKVLLALAFRFAVNSMLAGDVGMMILDEPTAGVDTDNISSLTDMLDRVSDYTKNEGKQLILITHDERLERAFDQIIRIDKVS